jgi:hypothetical protein
MRYAHAVLVVAAILTTSGCTLTEANGCPMHPGSNSNTYGLS